MKRKRPLLLLAVVLCFGLTSCVGYADIYEDYPPGYYDGHHRPPHKKRHRRHKKQRPPRPAPPPAPVYPYR